MLVYDFFLSVSEEVYQINSYYILLYKELWGYVWKLFGLSDCIIYICLSSFICLLKYQKSKFSVS